MPLSFAYVAALLLCAISASAQSVATINGGGSSAASAYIIASASTATSLASKPTNITYNTTSSTVGRQAATAGQLDFAISDVPFPNTSYPSNFSQIPISLGIFSVASDYNISGFKLDAPTLAGIYACTLTTWEQVSAAMGNTFSASGKITPVARSDSSGTTQLFTTYLSTAGPTAWPYGAGPLITFPSCVQTASGSANVASLIKSVSANSIGYLEFGIARNTSLISAALKNPSGNFISPATASGAFYDNLALPIPTSVANAGWANLNLGASTLSTSYPITSIEYLMVPTQLSSIPSKAAGSQALLKAFAGYLLSSQAQSNAQSTAFASFGALPQDILAVAVAGVNALVTSDNTAFGLPAPSSAPSPFNSPGVSTG